MRLAGGSVGEITGCEIYNNTASFGGGGIAVDLTPISAADRTVNIGGCTIQSNTVKGETANGAEEGVLAEPQAGYQSGGAGIYLLNTTPGYTNTTTVNIGGSGDKGLIHNNSAEKGAGAGVYVNAVKTAANAPTVKVILDNMDVTSNRAKDGAGVYTENHSDLANMNVLFGSVAFNGNKASNNGGAMNLAPAFQTLSGVNVIGNRAEMNGGAIYLRDGARLTAIYGLIRGNEAGNPDFVQETDASADPDAPHHVSGSGVYVGKSDFILQGGLLNMDIYDDILITDPGEHPTEDSGSGGPAGAPGRGPANAPDNSERDIGHPVRVSRSITQLSRVYYISVSDDYIVGDVVVAPFGSAVTDVTPYLRNFRSNRIGTIIDKENPNLILNKIYFVDGVNGDDEHNDGTSPANAFLTFEHAKELLDTDKGTIYICGPVTVDDERTWSLPYKGQYLSRYSGFMLNGIYNFSEYAYKGDMIVVDEHGKLTLENIHIEDRYPSDEDFVAEGAVVRVNKGTLTIPDQTAENMSITSVFCSGKGGAIRNEGGTVNIYGGLIDASDAVGKGGAIYQNGTLNVTGNETVDIRGDILLGGSDHVITTDVSNFLPIGGTLSVDVEQTFAGRDIVVYPAGYVPTETDEQIYQLPPVILAQYYVDNEAERPNVLELKVRAIIYIDGVDGSDANDGFTPETAVLTFRRVYEIINGMEHPNGATVYVVNTVTTNETMTIGTQYRCGTETIPAHGSIFLSRYAQPVNGASIPGYNKPTNLNALVSVTGGVFTVDDAYIDGHDKAITSGDDVFITDAVTATDALVKVSGGGFDFVKGTMTGAVNSNTTGGAVHVANGGVAHIKGGTIENCADGNNAAVYQNGTLKLSGSPVINGIVYLAAGKYVDILDSAPTVYLDNAETPLSGSKYSWDASTGTVRIYANTIGNHGNESTVYVNVVFSVKQLIQIRYHAENDGEHGLLRDADNNTAVTVKGFCEVL